MDHIFLIGPGGAGKSTCGRVLSQRLSRPFIDLDAEFTIRIGNIDSHLQAFGYEDYFRTNSLLFRDIVTRQEERSVFALSSGFLTYPDEAVLSQNKELIARFGTSICLMPSDNFEECVSIILGRQLQRGLNLEADSQRAAIEKRFWIYRERGDYHVYSSGSPESVVDSMASILAARGMPAAVRERTCIK